MKRIRNHTRKKKKQNNYTFSIKKGGSRIRITLKDDNHIIRKESTKKEKKKPQSKEQTKKEQTKKEQTKKEQTKKPQPTTQPQTTKKKQPTQSQTKKKKKPPTPPKEQPPTQKSTGELWSAVKESAIEKGREAIDEKRKIYIENLHNIWKKLPDKDDLEKMGIDTAKNIMSMDTEVLREDPELTKIRTINKQYKTLMMVVHPDKGIVENILMERTKTNSRPLFNNDKNIPSAMVNEANTILKNSLTHIKYLHEIWQKIMLDKKKLDQMDIDTAKEIMSMETDVLIKDPDLTNLNTINKQYKTLLPLVDPDKGIIQNILIESANTDSRRFFNNDINIPFAMVNAANTILNNSLTHIKYLHNIWQNIMRDGKTLDQMDIDTAKEIMSMDTEVLRKDPVLTNLDTINKQYKTLLPLVDPKKGMIQKILFKSANTDSRRFFNNDINIPFAMVNAANTILNNSLRPKKDTFSKERQAARAASPWATSTSKSEQRTNTTQLRTDWRAKRAAASKKENNSSHNSSRKSTTNSGQRTTQQRTNTTRQRTTRDVMKARREAAASQEVNDNNSSSTSSRPTSSRPTSSRPTSSSSKSSRPTSSRPTSSRPTESSSSTKAILTNAFKDAKKGIVVASDITSNITSKITTKRLTLDDIVNQSTNVVTHTKNMMELMKNVEAINNVDTNMKTKKTLAVNTLKEATESLYELFNKLNTQFDNWAGTNKTNEIIISFLKQAIEIENAKMTVLKENNTALTKAQVNYVKQILAEIKYSYERIKGAHRLINNLQNPVSLRKSSEDTIIDEMNNIMKYWDTIDKLEYKDNSEVKQIVNECESVIHEATKIFKRHHS